MYVRDLEGIEFACQATVTNDYELNGNQSISCTIYASKVNKLFINEITEMWEIIDFEDVAHKIIYAKKKGEGNGLTVEIKAIPLFFDTFDTLRIYEEYNEHMTAQLAFTRIFADTPFNFVLVDQFDAVEWEGFGAGEARLETFKRALERYKAEFRIVGNTVYLHKLIGRDTQFMYRYRLNASNIEQENDASAMWTYAKGYGDYGDGEGGEDWKDAKLIREYTSPLSSILGIRHAPPIHNGNIKVASFMDEQLKTLVDESLKISVSADIHDLRKQGYPIAQAEVGDRVFLIDERIGLDDEVRVVDISITRNWKGEVIDLNLTFGSEGIVKRHQSNLSTAIKNIINLLEGKIKLPYSVYDDAIKNAVTAIKNARTELVFPEDGGIWGIDKDNPNYVTGFTSRGFMVSVDGGATAEAAITGEGVIAEKIIGQSIIGVNIASVDETGYFHVSGSDAEFVNVTNNRRVMISPDGLYGYNSGGSVRFQADSTLVTSSALGTSNLNVYLAAEDIEGIQGEVRAVRRSSIPGSGNASDYSYINLRTRAMKSPPGSNAYIGTDGELRIMSEGLISNGVYRNARMSKAYANELEVNGGDILYLRSNNRVRIMGNGSSGSYSDLQVAHIQAQSIRKNNDMAGTHFYLGTNEGELRVTSNGLAEGVHRPVRASQYLLPDGTSAFAGLSSDRSLKPTENEATSVVNSFEVLRYTEDDKPAYKINSEESSLDEQVAYALKAIQELSNEVEELKGVM